MNEAGQKGFKTIKGMLSGVQNLDMMPFIMERLTEFSSQIEFLPSLISFLPLLSQLPTYHQMKLGKHFLTFPLFSCKIDVIQYYYKEKCHVNTYTRPDL